jgi:hypothetical protein
MLQMWCSVPTEEHVPCCHNDCGGGRDGDSDRIRKRDHTYNGDCANGDAAHRTDGLEKKLSPPRELLKVPHGQTACHNGLLYRHYFLAAKRINATGHE